MSVCVESQSYNRTIDSDYDTIVALVDSQKSGSKLS